MLNAGPPLATVKVAPATGPASASVPTWITSPTFDGSGMTALIFVFFALVAIAAPNAFGPPVSVNGVVRPATVPSIATLSTSVAQVGAEPPPDAVAPLDAPDPAWPETPPEVEAPELPPTLPPLEPPLADVLELLPDEEGPPPPEPEQLASAPRQAESPAIAQHALLVAPPIVCSRVAFEVTYMTRVAGAHQAVLCDR
jgi:hypothetical protein